MEWTEFVVALVEALAWPAAVLVLAVSFRETFRGIASGDVKRWKAGPSGFEVEHWDREAMEVKEAVARELPTRPRVESQLPGLGEFESHPGGAVVAAFASIESELRRLVIDNKVMTSAEASSAGARRLANLALDAELITPESATAIDGLLALRNLSAHGQAEQLDYRRAVEFVAMTDAVLFALSAKSGSSG